MRERGGEEGGGAREADEPAHHARRPMNAFLIFCKRHRAVVRDKYPNLENRSITKILGEWWANLDEEEKSCYTGLAKQYKDAFFNANPDFKWYKLPAPPLRTLSARPAPDRLGEPPPPHPPHPYLQPHPQQPDPCEPLRTNNNSTKYDYNRRRQSGEEPPLSMFTPGKLADEAHMGGLSSLITSNAEADANPDRRYLHFPYSVADRDLCPHPDRPKPHSKEDSIRELQIALSETTRIFEDLDEKSKPPNRDGDRAPGAFDDNITNQEIIDQVVDRGLHADESNKTDWTESDRATRSGRSCKGKRYQEFMAVGGLLAGKRPRRDERDAPDGWEYDGSRSPDELSERADRHKLEGGERADAADGEVDEAKPFRPADFDLDAKIRALPSLSLEKFQERKRENKRKKKSGFGIKAKASPAKCGGAAQPRVGDDAGRRREPRGWPEAVIGSQKRKPRKISITRLEVHSMVNRTGEVETSPEIKIATEAPYARVHGTEAAQLAGGGGGGLPVDLFALATLAEVAANTSKMEADAPALYQYQV